jgi:hypothetical protein
VDVDDWVAVICQWLFCEVTEAHQILLLFDVEINSIFGARVQPDGPCPAYRRYKVTHQIPELWNTSILIMVMQFVVGDINWFGFLSIHAIEYWSFSEFLQYGEDHLIKYTAKIHRFLRLWILNCFTFTCLSCLIWYFDQNCVYDIRKKYK